MSKRKDTRVEFVHELEKLWALYPHHKDLLQMMIDEAKEGEFHDFKNDKYICGKVAASAYLRQMPEPEAIALAEAVESGEYDETADAEDRAQMAKDLEAHGAGDVGGIFGL